MLTWNQLNSFLASANVRHQSLRGKFVEFAKQAAERFKEPNFHIKGVVVELNLEENFFLAKFVGRKVRFQFETAFGQHDVLVGVIGCYVKEEFPAPEYRQIGTVKFNGSGETDLVAEDGEKILIDADIGALYIVLNFVHKSIPVQPQID